MFGSNFLILGWCVLKFKPTTESFAMKQTYQEKKEWISGTPFQIFKSLCFQSEFSQPIKQVPNVPFKVEHWISNEHVIEIITRVRNEFFKVKVESILPFNFSIYWGVHQLVQTFSKDLNQLDQALILCTNIQCKDISLNFCIEINAENFINQSLLFYLQYLNDCIINCLKRGLKLFGLCVIISFDNKSKVWFG